MCWFNYLASERPALVIDGEQIEAQDDHRVKRQEQPVVHRRAVRARLAQAVRVIRDLRFSTTFNKLISIIINIANNHLPAPLAGPTSRPVGFVQVWSAAVKAGAGPDPDGLRHRTLRVRIAKARAHEKGQ